MSRKYTLEEVKQEFIKRGYEPLFDEYKNNSKPLNYRCLKHPKEKLKISLLHLKSGHGCPYCAGVSKNKIEDIKQEFIKRNYIPLFEQYKNNKSLLEYKCKIHNEKELAISFNNLKNGHGCPYCKNVARHTLEEVKQIFIDSGYIPLFNEYKNSKSLLEYQCPKHPSKKLKITFYGISIGYGCPYCAGVAKYKIEEARGKFIERNYIPLFDSYKDNKSLLKYKCPKHPEEELKISLNSLNKGSGCPYCALEQTQSKGCNKIEEFLNNNNIKYIKEHKFNNCRNKQLLPFDFSIFQNNNIEIIIEFDGEQHFKPKTIGGMSKEKAQKAFELTQKRDAIKNKFCEDNNIPLLRIPYWEEKNIEKILTEKLIELGILNNIA